VQLNKKLGMKGKLDMEFNAIISHMCMHDKTQNWWKIILGSSIFLIWLFNNMRNGLTSGIGHVMNLKQV
jgi:hypothetical protein